MSLRRLSSLSVLVPAFILAAGCVALVLFILQQYRLTVAALEKNEMRVSQLVGLGTSATLEASLRRGDTSEARRAVERANTLRGLTFAFYVAPDGTIPYATPTRLVGRTLDDPELRELRDRVDQVRGRVRGDVTDRDDRARILGVYPVFLDTVGGGRVGAFVYEHDISLQRALVVREARAQSIVAGLCLLALCLGLWAFLRRVLLVRIARVRDYASAVSEGEGRVRVDVAGHDEIGLLARHLEEAAATLAERSRLLRQSQKMEAIGRLAGGVAHDFNNLLMVILGNVEIARAQLEAEDRSDHGGSISTLELIEEIERAGTRAAALTKQLLAFSRQDVVQPRVLSPTRVIEQMTSLLDRVTGPKHQFHIESGTSLGVRIDRSQLEQVVLNLVVNARDAMPGGGGIVVRCNDQRWRDPESLTEVSTVEISVTDEGSGIPADVVDHVFEPFFTTKPLGHGTGLGLSTVFTVVTEAGGTVEVESEVDIGTRFRVTLPGVEFTESVAGADDDAFTDGEGDILYCEDDPAVLVVTARLLENHGYRVHSVGSGAAALAWLVENGEAVDILLTDVLMPEMDGLELARRAVEIQPELRVVFVSGYSSKLGAEELADFPNAAFLAKPFNTRALLESLRDEEQRETVDH